MYIMICSFAVD